MKTKYALVKLEQVGPDEHITPSCLMSYGNGAPTVMAHSQTIGTTPESYSRDRSFWKPTTIMEVTVENVTDLGQEIFNFIKS